MLGSSVLGEAVIKTRLDTSGVKTGLQQVQALTGNISGNGRGVAQINQTTQAYNNLRGALLQVAIAEKAGLAPSKQLADSYRNIATTAQRLGSELGKNAQELNRFRQVAIQATNAANRLDKQLEATHVSGGRLGGILTTIGSGYAARQYLNFTRDAALYSAQAAASLKIFNDVLEANNISQTKGADSIKMLSDRFKVTEETAAQAAIPLLRMGASLEQVELLLGRGAASALAYGRTTSEGFNAVSDAIVSQRSVLLNGIGITQDLGVANLALARSLGKTTTELTTQEKVQAALNLVLSETAEEYASLDDLQKGVLGTQSDLEKQAFETKKAFGEAASDGLSAFNQGLIDIMEAAGQEGGIIDIIGGWTGSVLTDIAADFNEIATALDNISKERNVQNLVDLLNALNPFGFGMSRDEQLKQLQNDLPGAFGPTNDTGVVLGPTPSVNYKNPFTTDRLRGITGTNTGGSGTKKKTDLERLLERIAGAETDYRNTIKNIGMLFPDTITQDEAWKSQLDATNSALKILLDNYSLLTDEQKLFVTQLQASKKELEGFVGESERLDDITKAFDKAGREGTLANKMALVKTASGELDPVTAELEAVDTRIKVLGNLIETLYELGASDAQIQNAVTRRDALISQYNARSVVPDFFGGANNAVGIPVPNVSTGLTDRGQTALARSDYANRQALAAIFAQNPDFNGNFAGSRGSLTISQLKDLLRVLNQVPVGQFMRGFDYGNNGEYQRDILGLGILPGGTGSIPGFTTNANRLENQRRGNIASYQMNQAQSADTSSTRYAAMKDAEYFRNYLRDQHIAGYERALALGASNPTNSGNVRELAFNYAELKRGEYERMLALGAFTTPMGVGGVSRVTQDAFLTPSYLQNIGGLGGLGGMSDEAIKGLIRNGVISSPFGATDEGVSAVRAAVEGANEAADIQKEAADRFAETVVSSGIQFVGELSNAIRQGDGIGVAQAGLGLGANILGGADLGTLPFLSGSIGIAGLAAGGLGLFSGLLDLFRPNDEEKRKQEALRNQNRQLPTLNIDFAFNQYNQWTGQPSDPENVGALTQQSGEMAMLVEKVILPAIQQHSNKLGLSTP